jgi:hypothetical protein
LFRLIDHIVLVSNIQRALYERNIHDPMGQVFRQPTVRVFIRESVWLQSAHSTGGPDIRIYHLFNGILI